MADIDDEVWSFVIKNNDLTELKRIFESDVNKPNYLLVTASIYDRVEITKYLLDKEYHHRLSEAYNYAITNCSFHDNNKNINRNNSMIHILSKHHTPSIQNLLHACVTKKGHIVTYLLREYFNNITYDDIKDLSDIHKQQIIRRLVPYYITGPEFDRFCRFVSSCLSNRPDKPITVILESDIIQAIQNKIVGIRVSVVNISVYGTKVMIYGPGI